jgi:hypothetical protein
MSTFSVHLSPTCTKAPGGSPKVLDSLLFLVIILLLFLFMLLKMIEPLNKIIQGLFVGEKST